MTTTGSEPAGEPTDERSDESAERAAEPSANGAASTEDAEQSAGKATETTDDEYTFEDVSVVMGTYNEEAAIETVLSDVEAVTDGAAEVVCVDGSSDRTPEIAREHGARVIRQPPRGYGHAVRAALLAATRPVVVTTDCDDTYPMEALPDFLAAINDGADVVSGDRLSRGAEAMPDLNRRGNRWLAALAGWLVGHPVVDATTGMRAYRREVIDSIEWSENTGLSAELLMRPLARGYDVRQRPIDYRERAGETTLDPLRGGAAIGYSILKVGLEERYRNSAVQRRLRDVKSAVLD